MASALVACFDCVEGDCGAWKWVHGSRCVVSGCLEVGVRGRKPEGLLVCFGVAQFIRYENARGIGTFAFLRVVVLIVVLACLL